MILVFEGKIYFQYLSCTYTRMNEQINSERKNVYKNPKLCKLIYFLKIVYEGAHVRDIYICKIYIFVVLEKCSKANKKRQNNGS